MTQVKTMTTSKKGKSKKQSAKKLEPKKLFFLTKTRNGTFEVLNELEYEKRLIYGI